MKSPLLNRRDGEGAVWAPKEDQGDDVYPREGKEVFVPEGRGARERGKIPHYSPSTCPTPGGSSGLGIHLLSLLGLPFLSLPSLSQVDLLAPLWAPCTAHIPPAALSESAPSTRWAAPLGKGWVRM